MKNFMISTTILDNDTCSGPKCGFTENMYTSFKELENVIFIMFAGDMGSYAVGQVF